MDLVLQRAILLRAPRSDCCVHEQGQEGLAQVGFLFSSLLVDKFLLALLYNSKYLRPVVEGLDAIC